MFLIKKGKDSSLVSFVLFSRPLLPLEVSGGLPELLNALGPGELGAGAADPGVSTDTEPSPESSGDLQVPRGDCPELWGTAVLGVLLLKEVISVRALPRLGVRGALGGRVRAR